MDSLSDELINKPVIVVKTDKFVMVGIIKEISSSFLKLYLYNGQTQYVPLAVVSRIEIDKSRKCR